MTRRPSRRLPRWDVDFAERFTKRDGSPGVRVVLACRARTLDEAVSIAHGRWRDGEFLFVDIIDTADPRGRHFVARYSDGQWTGITGDALTRIGRTEVAVAS